jgi:putative lipoic acid-binding regulatory protein
VSQDPVDERERLLALLQAQHTFPGDYYLSVITVTDGEVFTALVAVLEVGLEQPLGEQAFERVPSRTGKYTSHRVRVPVQAAEDVLALYERIRLVVGVVNVF